jgi:hypothetical protein
MHFLLRNLELETYYAGSACWVSELARAFDFGQIENAERFFLEHNVQAEPGHFEILLVEGEAQCGIKLPIASELSRPPGSAQF